MNIIIKRLDNLDDNILDFLTNESFNLFCKVKSINEEKKEVLLFLKQKLRNIYEKELPKNKIYVAYLDNNLVGIACIDNNNYFSDLFVKKEYQNKGIGTMLLKKVVEENKQYGNITMNANKEYLDFYLNNEFKIMDESKDSIRMKL